MTKARNFQFVGEPGLNRLDHVWFRRKGRWKCCLCGSVTRKSPPPRRRKGETAPETWLPEAVEPLTREERALCPPEAPCDGQ